MTWKLTPPAISREFSPARGVEEPVITRQPTEAQPALVENASAGETAEIFEKELKALGGEVYRVKESELLENLVGFLREHGLKNLQIWENVPAISQQELAGAYRARFPLVRPSQRRGTRLPEHAQHPARAHQRVGVPKDGHFVLEVMQ